MIEWIQTSPSRSYWQKPIPRENLMWVGWWHANNINIENGYNENMLSSIIISGLMANVPSIQFIHCQLP